MFVKNAKETIMEYAQRSYSKKKFQINDRITYYVGWGLCNMSVIETENTVILIDTPDSDARAERLLADIDKCTGKPIKTIIFTHNHRDHIGGAGVFSDSNPEVILHTAKYAQYKYTDKISGILNKRLVAQFGYTLNSDDYLTQGGAISDSNAVGDGKFNFIKPTKIIDSSVTDMEIDGVKIQLIAAPGETDDHMYVWLPDDKVLFCGDNYYGCFPNLYAIRGGQYRDIAQWIDSTKKILEYPAVAVLPGHTQPLIGEAQIKTVITEYTEALEDILLQTLDCMNKGMSISETVKKVKLNNKYASSPYLGEFYGTLEWSVRSIYTAYLGWFDGNPVNLFPVSDDKFSAEILKIAGKNAVIKAAEEKMASEEYQLAVQLAELIINAEKDTSSEQITTEDVKQMLKLKATAFRKLGEMQTSLNGRHYYLTYSNNIIKGI